MREIDSRGGVYGASAFLSRGIEVGPRMHALMVSLQLLLQHMRTVQSFRNSNYKV